MAIKNAEGCEFFFLNEIAAEVEVATELIFAATGPRKGSRKVS